MDDWVVLAVGAGAAAVLWLVIFDAAAFLTRPREAEPQPAGLEFGGPESPAVAGLLCSGWTVPRAAIAATAVDLAARHALELTDVGDDRYTVAVRSVPDDALPYERQVLDLVKAKQAVGPVPVEALSLGDDKDARIWWGRFERSVRKDARGRGLSRDRWGAVLLVLFVLGALVPSGLLALSALNRPAPKPATAEETAASTSTTSKDEDPVTSALMLGALGAWIPLTVLLFGARHERDTPEGLTVAGRWLGLRENLEADGNFPDLPPTAVAIWDRYLAYAVAFGIAAHTAHALPFSAESPTEAWSCVTGRWRVVHIRYRAGLFGKSVSPIATAWGGILRVGVPAVVGTWLAPEFVPELRDLVAESGAGWVAVLDVGVALAGLLLAVTAVIGLAMIVVGISDIRRSRIVEGEILRLRDVGSERTGYTRWIAVDDGTRDEIYAWVVHHSEGQFYIGSRVRAQVTPRLRYLRTVSVLNPPPVAAFGDPAVSGATAAPLDLTGVSEIVGEPLAPALSTGKAVYNALRRRIELRGATTSLWFHTRHLGGDMHRSFEDMVRSLAPVRSMVFEPVDDIGEEARWVGGSLLVVRDGPKAIAVHLEREGMAADDRKRMSVAIAHLLHRA